MKNKTINTIDKIICAVLAILSLICVIEVWFYGYSVSTFEIGFNYLFISIIASLEFLHYRRQ